MMIRCLIQDVDSYLFVNIFRCASVGPGTCWVQIDWQDASTIFTDAPPLTNERAMMQHDSDKLVTCAVHLRTHLLL